MWICRKCLIERPFSELELEIDDDGFFFSCPTCWHRNALVDVGEEPNRFDLVQPDLDWPSGKPWRK